MSRALTIEQVDELVALRKSRKLRQRDVAELAGGTGPSGPESSWGSR